MEQIHGTLHVLGNTDRLIRKSGNKVTFFLLLCPHLRLLICCLEITGRGTFVTLQDVQQKQISGMLGMRYPAFICSLSIRHVKRPGIR